MVYVTSQESLTNLPPLKPGDIVLTRSDSLIGRLIRKFSRVGGESRTIVNHVGIVVDITNNEPIIVEALSTVKRHPLLQRFANKKIRVSVYRPINLTDTEIDIITAKANSYVNKKYGYFKIAMHFLDWSIGGIYLFRRLANSDDYPICSWLVAAAFAAAGKYFGCEVGQAEPDDIWDFVNANTDKYINIWPI